MNHVLIILAALIIGGSIAFVVIKISGADDDTPWPHDADYSNWEK